MRWFKINSVISVGIDLGARYLKMLALSQNNGQFEIHSFAIVELPITVLSESNEIKDPATISAILTQLNNQYNLNAAKTAIALPGASAITKQIMVDANLPERELEAQAYLDASKHFPGLIDDLSLDFYIQGPSETDKTKLDVLLVACRKNSIEKCLEILRGSRFNPEVIDIEYYALERALNYILQQQADLPKDQTYAVLNFSARASTLVVVHNQKLLYAYDQTFESQKLLQKLQQLMQWPNLLLHPEQVAGELNTACIEILEETLLSHVRYVLGLFYSSKQDNQIQQLFLAGDCALIPGIAAWLSQQLGLNIIIANPIINMKIAPTIEQKSLQACASALTLCCGLAMHEGQL